MSRIFNIGQQLGSLQKWLKNLGNWGIVLYILIYIAAVVAAIPGSALTLAAGALFGTFKGVIIVSLASTTGAGLAFLISRYVAREGIVRWLSDKELFAGIEDLIEKHGAMTVAIARLLPVFPFNLLNYGFGLTKISFRAYLFWSWLCMLPGTVLYVAGADALTLWISGGGFSRELIGILLSAGLILVIAAYFAKRKL